MSSGREVVHGRGCGRLWRPQEMPPATPQRRLSAEAAGGAQCSCPPRPDTPAASEAAAGGGADDGGGCGGDGAGCGGRGGGGGRRRGGVPGAAPAAVGAALRAAAGHRHCRSVCWAGGRARTGASHSRRARGHVAAVAAAFQPEESLTRGRLTRPRLVCPLVISDPPFLPVLVAARRVSDVPERAFGHEPPHHVYVTHSNDRGPGAELARGQPVPRGTIFHPWVTVETKI